MENKAIFSIAAGGIDVTAGKPKTVHSIHVSDRAGSTSDSANIVLDDTDGAAAYRLPAQS
jgi:phage protein D